MSDPQGLITFDGVMQPLFGQVVFNHGISPSVIIIEMVPQQQSPAQVGTVTLAYGELLIQFFDCKLDNLNLEYDQSGMICRLQIFDRRWKWAFGNIQGTYNQYLPDGSVAYQKAPQELASLCLQAMNEVAFDVSQVPNDSLPPVDWNEPPAQALGKLADLLGCRVVLRLDNTVAVVPLGYGNLLPIDETVMADSLSIDPPECPDDYVVQGAPIMYQPDLPLRAVGLDLDGQLKPLSTMDYAPSGGFSQVDLGAWNNLQNPQVRQLADQCAYKWYAIDTSQPISVPGYDGAITRIEQILPLLPTRAETIDDNQMSEATRYKPPLVYGVWYDRLHTASADNTVESLEPPSSDDPSANPSIYTGAYSIDLEHGIVKFAQPVFLQNTQGSSAGETYQPAQLALRIGVNVKDSQTNAPIRHTRSRASGSAFGTLPRYYLHDEIQRRIVPSYDDSDEELADNIREVDEQCDYYCDAAELEYNAQMPQTVTYNCLRYIELDGAIQQVAFTVGPQGASTRANYNNDFHPASIPFKQRRMLETYAGRVSTGR